MGGNNPGIRGNRNIDESVHNGLANLLGILTINIGTRGM